MNVEGQKLAYDLSKSGMVSIPNKDILAPQTLSQAENVVFTEYGCKKRKGTKIHAFISSNASNGLTGIFQYSVGRGTEKFISYGTDGDIWFNDTGAGAGHNLVTGLASNVTPSFATLDDNVYIANGINPLQVFDGVRIADLGDAKTPSDWEGTNQPEWIYTYHVGNSQVLVAFYNNTLYMSGLGDDDFSDGNVTILEINPGDGYGILGASTLKGQLVLFGKNKSYLMDSTDSLLTNWTYTEAPWVGGVGSRDLIVKTPNNIVCMTEDGEIYSVVDVFTSNEYQRASIAQPSGMYIWIRDNVNLSNISSFHSVYDAYNRFILFFVSTGSSNSIDTCLVYHVDRSPEEAWSIFNNITYASGYTNPCSTVGTDNIGKPTIYTGDTSGQIWECFVTDTDDGNVYKTLIRTNYSPVGSSIHNKKMVKLDVISESDNTSLDIKVHIDGKQTTTGILTFTGVGVSLGTFLLGTNSLYDPEPNTQRLNISEHGKRISIELSTETANNNFYLTSLVLSIDQIGEGI